MPSFSTPHRTTTALPATLPRGGGAAIREAATLTLIRLRGWAPVSTLSATQLREEIARSHREHEELGGGDSCPVSLDALEGRTKRELRGVALDLRHAVSALRLKKGVS